MKNIPMTGMPIEKNSQTDRRGGAPRGNRNRMRHGLFGSKLPKDCRYIENAVNAFRKQVEGEVIATHNEIGVYFAALVQSACRHETRAKLLQRWLRESANETKTTTSKKATDGNENTAEESVTRTTELGILEKSQLLREISNASDSRDKCLEKLRLDKANDTAWPMFPTLPEQTAQDATEPIPPPEDDTSDTSSRMTFQRAPAAS